MHRMFNIDPSYVLLCGIFCENGLSDGGKKAHAFQVLMYKRPIFFPGPVWEAWNTDFAIRSLLSLPMQIRQFLNF